MKYQIRRGAFETNSSSMHSLVVCNENYFDKEETYETAEDIQKQFGRVLDRKGYLTHEEFIYGRYPFKILANFYEKFGFAFASYCNNYPTGVKELESIVKKYVPDFHGLKSCTGIVEGSYLPDWLKKLNISLEEFLINNRYIVIIDGDEYCTWDTICETGIITKEITEV